MSDEGLALGECINMYEEKWFEEFREAAQKGLVEQTLIYAKMLLRGSDSRYPDVAQALHYLRHLSKRSSEAAYRLGRLYHKGEFIKIDLETAYLFYK